MMIDFSTLWRYFAWCNQTLAAFTLWGATAWLARAGRNYIATLLPALFMTAVSVAYLLCAPAPEGFGLAIEIAVGTAIIIAMFVLVLFIKKIHNPLNELRRING